MQNIEPEVCLDAQAKIVNGILRGMRRRGLPANVDTDDLRQEGLIALIDKSGPQCLLSKIAKNAMIDYLNEKRAEWRDTVALTTDDHGEMIPDAESIDPFFTLPVDDGLAYRSAKAIRRDGPIETLASRHETWESERANFWAGVRG